MSTRAKIVKTKIQPFLFFEMAIVGPAVPVSPIERDGKKVVDRLLDVRRGLSGGELAYLAQINECIERIRSFSRVSDTQREEIVLYAVEKQMCWTLTEIIEQTKMDKEEVKKIVLDLGKRKILYFPKQHIIGNCRPRTLIKSRRVQNVEAD